MEMHRPNRREKLLVIVLIGLMVLPAIWYTTRSDKPESAANNQTTASEAEQTKSEEKPAETQSEAPKATFDKSKYSTTEAASPWVVVNKQHSLNPLQYAPSDLVSAGGSQQMRQEATTALAKLFAGAKAEGLTLQALSGYRSYARQQTVYQNYVNTYGQAEADTFSANPGYSEHQTGWAIDIGGGGCGIEDCFANTPHGKWVAANGHKYGFIVRYPAGKQAVTGYKYEPWHIRYVGVELATEMHSQNVQTLEEFFNL